MKIKNGYGTLGIILNENPYAPACGENYLLLGLNNLTQS